ncbi:lysine transporter LysE [Humibacillus sp. DSM 29435]|uniref:LysE family transporter n=1 Tax=Humibacillus sp. DSM 29435 TaxID=1869167 RepID=UPI000872D35F|nr:LysE family transporter [Humibacillus sp. DSM 29435]OFE15608.1 lysine transporter LysE [Humibacillus sp. DSM 29435]
MSWSLWLTLVVTGVLISLTPGAGAINTMANALGVGWARSVWGILGQQVGLLAYVVVVAAGVGVIVTGSPVIFNVIRYAGAAYLVLLGIRQWRARAQVIGEGSAAQVVTRRSMIRRGLLVNLTNPKALLFFLAFMPQFIRPDRPLLPQYLVFAATIVVVDVLVMWFFFATAARGLRRITRNPRGQGTLNKLFGGLFVGMGALLATVH